jgi:AcrR family transcriptional regulator
MSTRPARTRPRAGRRRLRKEESRARILAAAEHRLAEVGPEGLRLTELAAELGISHPAILHHYGSREELIEEVVTQATAQLNERLVQAIASREPGGHEAIFEMIAEFYGAEGRARTIAWLVLSRRTAKKRPRQAAPRPLERLIELAHARRMLAHPERSTDFADTQFRSQLAALALLGEAVFGRLIRYASGEAGTADADASRDFRRRLAALLGDAS